MKPACSITEQPLDPADLKPAIQDPSCGGHSIFVGTVRKRNHEKEVFRLEYQAYAPMAEKVFSEIAEEAKEKFGVKGCSIVHRVGILEPGEISVAVAIASEHRKEAFAACQYVVSELKRRAPIWKKEVYRDGTSAWLGGEENVELD